MRSALFEPGLMHFCTVVIVAVVGGQTRNRGDLASLELNIEEPPK